jgi:hypothetical protein
MNDEFYIGWEKKAAPGIGKTAHKAVIIILSLALAVPLVLAVSQHMIGASVFEWGTLKSVSGVLQSKPYPHLLVPRPGNVDSQSPFSTYYLVMTWKFGINPEAIAPLDGKPVTVKGTLIYRENHTMIETKPEWIAASTNAVPQTLIDARYQDLGKQTFVGEIVDSKCFLGVMNPGRLATHRGCAIRCISGGCPPILVVDQKDGPAIYLLLVSADKKPVNKQVLDMVAEPLEITGEVERQGDLLILRADPTTYRRIK